MNTDVANEIIEVLVRFVEELATLLDRDHKPLKGGGRRKQSILHKANAILVMTLLIPRLPVLSIHVSSICR